MDSMIAFRFPRAIEMLRFTSDGGRMPRLSWLRYPCGHSELHRITDHPLYALGVVFRLPGPCMGCAVIEV